MYIDNFELWGSDGGGFGDGFGDGDGGSSYRFNTYKAGDEFGSWFGNGRGFGAGFGFIYLKGDGYSQNKEDFKYLRYRI